jgi:catechol 2,3-dioxygenase-like lactoylglutathione lyase family enzyme
MKRMHIHVGVDDLAQSVGFYTTLFGTAPTRVEADYAKWLLDDPRVNFAISTGHAGRGIEHLGIQVETAAELADVGARLAEAGAPMLNEAATTCCYATSDKAWVRDPQGVVWETFLTTGVTTHYGASPALAQLAPAPPKTGCCG